MHKPLALTSSPPTVGDHLENLVLLGCGLLILVIALALCSFLFDKLSKAGSASADWLERRAARKRRRTRLKKYYPPVRSSHLRIVSPPPADARRTSALRRNASRIDGRNGFNQNRPACDGEAAREEEEVRGKFSHPARSLSSEGTRAGRGNFRRTFRSDFRPTQSHKFPFSKRSSP